MVKKTTGQLREEFLLNEVLASSVSAAFGHAGVYNKSANESNSLDLRRDLKQALRLVAEDYRNHTPDDETHLQTIQGIANGLSEKHAPILNNGRFRLGIAQKALNLFLKYRWCMGDIKTPPHCPFDRIVLDALREYARDRPFVPWTKMDDSDEYCRYVSAARTEAAGVPLAVWELRLWSGKEIG